MGSDSKYKITKILEINNDLSNKKSWLSISCTPGYSVHVSGSPTHSPRRTSEDRDAVIAMIREDVETIKANKYDIVLCLLTWEEMDKLNMMEYPNQLQEKNILFLHLPIFDGYIPSITEMNPIINKLVHNLLSGSNILIHCRCGYGRAGTIAACMLLHFNYTCNTATKLIRSRRSKAIQTEAQEQFIAKYEGYLCASSPR